MSNISSMRTAVELLGRGTRTSHLFGLLTVVFLVTACGPSLPAWTEEVEFSEELDLDFGNAEVTETGLIIIPVAEGTGESVASGDVLGVYYTGWLADGTKFDSSRDREEVFPYQLDVMDVVPGWEEGMQGMKQGERRILVMPSELGYGDRPIGLIPANSVLIFDVEIMTLQKPGG